MTDRVSNFVSRRRFLQASGLAAVSAALAACAAPAAGDAAADTDDSGTMESSSVKIRTGFGQGHMTDAMQGAVDRFVEENSDYTAEHVIVPWGELHNNVIKNTAAGTPPDSYRG